MVVVAAAMVAAVRALSLLYCYLNHGAVNYLLAYMAWV
jgi:hypothetical protein